MKRDREEHVLELMLAEVEGRRASMGWWWGG